MVTAPARPALTAGEFNALVDEYLALLERDGIRRPLTREFTLWCVFQDLADLLGIPDDDLHPQVIACGDRPVTAA